ncbi:hypothetical protein [Cellulosimicrobium marinum]|uniref:hypothetical protein n=1 Tax=Cellulosimicrobium marinum TaxID=1638992 RepID=UPI001E350DA1|nr:hypothetical protein [Cellulosimicrobium marinum]MCB7137973.1 hypothetical protein [Cellulosimicrobium marinum]
MSDNGSNMQPVRPLTRREIREREQAAAAQRAAEQATPPGAPSGGAAWPTAAGQRPAAPPPPAPSRRSMRESTGATQHPAQPTVVRPPAASGGMRGLDETGRLTPVQETAERHTIRPQAQAQAPAPAVPTRTSSRTPAPGPRPAAPGASGPVRPSTPAGDAFGGPSGRTVPGSAPTPFPQGAPRTENTQPQPQRMSAFASSTGATTAPRPDAPAPSPWDQGRPAGQAALAPGHAPEPTAALPWAAITSGSAPEPAASQRAASSASPFPPAAGAGPDGPAAAGGDDLFPRVRSRDEEEGADEHDETPEEVRGPSYTWLHYLILVAVAFVLGLLVWELISQDDPGPATEALAPATVVTTDPVALAGPDLGR